MKPMRDPAMKRVGRGAYVCALEACGKPLNEVTVSASDPFCSTGCCKTWHGVEIQQNVSKRGVPVGSSS